VQHCHVVGRAVGGWRQDHGLVLQQQMEQQQVQEVQESSESVFLAVK
jgi:hypothetical protein